MIPVKYWLLLGVSIILETTGTSVMKLSSGGWPVTGLIVMYLSLGLSYFFLARAVTRIPLGVAYAFWEGIGLVLITLASALLLGEAITPARLAALGMVLAGSLLVHHGTEGGNAKGAAHEAGGEHAGSGS